MGMTASLLLNDTVIGAAPERLEIASIDIFPVIYPMHGRFKFFEDPAGKMQGRASAIVRITASDGSFGWGESIPIPKWSYETLESVTSTLRNYLRPVLIGENIFDKGPFRCL